MPQQSHITTIENECTEIRSHRFPFTLFNNASDMNRIIQLFKNHWAEIWYEMTKMLQGAHSFSWFTFFSLTQSSRNCCHNNPGKKNWINMAENKICNNCYNICIQFSMNNFCHDAFGVRCDSAFSQFGISFEKFMIPLNEFKGKNNGKKTLKLHSDRWERGIWE